MIVLCGACDHAYDDQRESPRCPHLPVLGTETVLPAPHRWTPEAASKAGRTGGRAARRPRRSKKS